MLLAGAGVTLGRRWRSRRTLDRIGGRPLVAGTPSFRVNGRRAVRTGGLSTSLSRDARSVHGRSFSAGCGQPVRVSSVPHPGKTETRLAASCAHFAEEKRLFFYDYYFQRCFFAWRTASVDYFTKETSRGKGNTWQLMFFFLRVILERGTKSPKYRLMHFLEAVTSMTNKSSALTVSDCLLASSYDVKVVST